MVHQHKARLVGEAQLDRILDENGEECYVVRRPVGYMEVMLRWAGGVPDVSIGTTATYTLGGVQFSGIIVANSLEELYGLKEGEAGPIQEQTIRLMIGVRNGKLGSL